MLAIWPAWSEPFVPKDDNQPLEHLRAVASDSSQRELRALRAKLSASPTNVPLAVAFGKLCLERYRAESDPRYLGRAQAALAPWWVTPAPPADLLVLRATLKQSQHQFADSLTDLDTALRLDPRNAQAWLTRATVLTVLGDYAAARRACFPLAKLAPGLVSVTAAASIACLSGSAERGCGLLQRTLDGNPSASAAEKLWAFTVLAEAYERLGRRAEAEHYYKAALALGLRDPYLLGAYADLLMDNSRANEAAELLKNETRSDGLLLRLTLAESAVSPAPASLAAHLDSLRARFEACRLRGDFVHQREEARFQLYLLHNPAEGLRLAVANWGAQHEPADVRILIEAARAAGRPEEADPALSFVHTNHLEYAILK